MSIRLATSDDLPRIKQICNQNRDFIGFVIKQSFLEGIEQKSLLVFEDNNLIKGFARFYRRLDGWNTLHEIAIDRDYKHQGVGQILFDQIPLPIRLKTTKDNIIAINFYSKNNMTHSRTEQGKKRRLCVFEKIS